MAVDLAHGKLYVMDGANHRVLRFAYPVTSNQPAAELVFGQPDFISNGIGTTQNTFNRPRGVVVDNTGRLWVSEQYNNRVVWFNAAYSLNTNQPPADGVLGQPDFTSNFPLGIICVAAQNRLCHPYGLAMSSNDTLFVADGNFPNGAGNHRVLRFDQASSKANGANADGVLGQPDFTSTASAATQNGMSNPRGVAIQGTTLFVAERDNHRVLRFDNAASKPNGANADGVLGQPDFTTNTQALTQTGLVLPARVSVDQGGRLYVSEGLGADRVLIYTDAANKLNGDPADFVIGQPDFTTQSSGTTQNKMDLDSSGGGLAIDYGNNLLLVADDFNNRVMIFQANFPSIVLNPADLTFSTTEGVNPASKTIALSNGGEGVLEWTAVADPGVPAWLSVTPGSGTGDGTLTVAVDSTGLVFGNYTKTITVTSPGATNTPQVVNVVLNVAPPPVFPAIVLNPADLTFSTTEGVNPANKTIALSNGGEGVLEWTAVADPGVPAWLSVTPGSGTGNGTLTVAVDSTGLVFGNYTKTITVTSPGATNTPQVVNVVLNVAPPPVFPAIVLNPADLTFSTTEGVNPANKTIALSNGGEGVLEWTAVADPGVPAWLSVTPGSGTGMGPSR